MSEDTRKMAPNQVKTASFKTASIEPADVGDPRTFAQQMALEQLDSHTFKSVFGASGGGIKVKYNGRLRARAYGGHVYAQAVWAASHTVKEGFLVHSVSGYYLSAGWCDAPFVYSVTDMRTGGSYVIRRVDVTQNDTDGVCFTATCSFKKPETSPREIQDTAAPEQRYQDFLRGEMPQDGPELEYAGMWASLKNTQRGYTTALPGTKTGVLPMHEYNKRRAPLDRRHLLYYSVNGDIPSMKHSPNLHACNHLYLCDHASVIITARHLDLDQDMIALASLSTTVVFHGGMQGPAMHDDAGKERWFCQEVGADRYADGRGRHYSRIWDEDGRHVATTCQDAQIKLRPDASPAKI